MRSIYHLAKADFLQRIRSYAFLVTLAFSMLAAYAFVPEVEAKYITVALGNYRGVYNSAWIGVMVAMMSSSFLSLAGFYLVNNSIQRDYDTGVGQILATTQISNRQYLAGKMLSNLAVLSLILIAIAVIATYLLLTRAEVPGFEPLNLYLPLLWITFPALAFIAALAVFFESFRWRNRGLMNVLFFFLFMFFISPLKLFKEETNQSLFLQDFFGVNIAFNHIKHDLRQQVSDYDGGESIGFLFSDKKKEFKTFEWNGFHFSAVMLPSRLSWIGAALFLLVLGGYIFKRFDPSYDPVIKDKKGKGIINTIDINTRDTCIPYNSLPKPRIRFSFFTLIKAEAKLLLQGVSRWWWLINAGIWIATLFTPLSFAHGILLPTLWVWQVLIWSNMGFREKLFHTEQVIFSAAHVMTRQLFAGWAASVAWALILASGVLFRTSWAGDAYATFAITTGAVFLPTFALFSGIWTGGGKLFQVIYILAWYALIQQIPFVDYLGAVPLSRNWNQAGILLAFSGGLLLLCVWGRNRQRMI